MRRIFIQQIIFLFLVCIPMYSMDLLQKIPAEVFDKIKKDIGLAATWNLLNTCKEFHNTIEIKDKFLQEYLDIVKKMDIDSYTKEMICLARSENMYMFQWLKDNTNEKNRDESQFIFRIDESFDYIYGPSDVDKKNRKLTLYRTIEYVQKKIPKFICCNIDILPFMRLLVHQGFNFNYQWKNGNTLLHLLVCRRDSVRQDIIEFLLAQPKLDVNIQNNKGEIPYKYLLQKYDIYVNIKNNKGETPLYYLIKNPCVTRHGCGSDRRITISWERAKFLLSDNRVDKTIVTNKRKTFLHYVAKYINDSETLNYFIQSKDINFKSVDYEGRTVLHIASKYHNIEAVHYLLEQMPSEIINLRDQKGYSALDYSVTTLKNKNKKKWTWLGREYEYLTCRDEKKTVELFLKSKKVCVPFLFLYRQMLFYGFFAMGLIGLSLYVFIHLW